ncbi:MAG TPA: GNAT family N-acetyltransferase [Bryobacteraceae bacterium]|nr:GNAT family N-acetyltransferase [Bryobacteraceae bacterium]
MIEIKALTERREFEDAVQLQRRIWGFQDIELLPVRLFVVANKVGGQTYGAYDGNRMVGFCLAIPGLKPGGKSYLHGHMLGVLPEYHNHGIGRLLKLRQREDALARGIELIEWTFDPLEIKNAYFNMERLGAIVRRYVENQYGTTTSFLHGGLPTDRCIAEWWIASDRVKAVLARQPLEHAVEERVAVPADIDRLRREDARRARAIQKDVGERLMQAFSRGLAVIGLEKTEQAGTYLLGRWA